MRKPTTEAAADFQRAFDYLNAQLFAGRLPQCLITLQRNKRSYGYFCYQQFADGATVTDEIALNPQYLGDVTNALSTLAHEMCHLWQYHFGKPGRRNYHNREFADMMQTIGLQPSTTGRPGGNTTGEKMDHYVIAGGPFERAVTESPTLRWKDRIGQRIAAVVADPNQPAEEVDVTIDATSETKTNRSNRIKYTCATCGLNAWAKPAVHLVCGDCSVSMAEAD